MRQGVADVVADSLVSDVLALAEQFPRRDPMQPNGSHLVNQDEAVFRLAGMARRDRYLARVLRRAS